MKGKLLMPGFLFVCLLVSCSHEYSPKPSGYFRLDMPEKVYLQFVSDCDFKFSYPNYCSVNKVTEHYAEPCWYNMTMPQLNATIYITYKQLDNNLGAHIEDVRTIVYKHLIKADDIEEMIIHVPENQCYGILYNIDGNTASSVNFFITDSVEHFISGALYFNTVPNGDSLKPAIDFLREDIVNLMQTTTWN